MFVVSTFFSKMLNRGPSVEKLPRIAEQSTLPRLIHQTFPRKVLPTELQASVDAIRAMNPDWRHVLYDDADVERFIRTEYGDEMFARFDQIDPIYGAARADLFRYLLLYRHGGVYLDIKSTATRPLDEVLRPDDRFLVAQWPDGPAARFPGAGWHEETRHIKGGEFQQWFVVASAGHPFLKAVIENVLRNCEVYNPALHGVGKPGVLRVTGPIAYTLSIAPMLGQHPHRRVDAEADLGFEYSIYPTVAKGAHQHLQLFHKHYSLSSTSLIRMTGAKAAITAPLMFAAMIAKRVRAATAATAR